MTVFPRWTEADIDWLKANYPNVGQAASAEHLGRTKPAVRQKCADLGIKQDRNSPFFKDWQKRAAESKVGKKRPAQAEVMRKNHTDGKLIKTKEQREAIGKRSKKWIAENGHPKGALGMKHTQETLVKLSDASKKNWRNMTEDKLLVRTKKAAATMRKNGTHPKNREMCTWKAGWREFGGKRNYYRSRWEANYGRYLEWLKGLGEIKDWEHEPDTFWFDGIKRGCVSYLPDFKVINKEGGVEYHEVKGWMDARSKTKIRRMAKYHPKVKLIVIDAKPYKEIRKKVGGMISGWEE